MSTAIKKLSWASIGALLVVGLVGCGGSNPDASATPQATTPSAKQPATEQPASNALSESAAQASTPIGTRKDVTWVLEQQLEEYNAKARWEGDTLYMSMDGERENPLNGRHCRLMDTLLEPTDSFVLEFPDGTIPCSEIPGAE
ncbi:hypothetical protein CQ018_18960 [Arthrobacter sp. MYb227]|uniref:hypothetical protein n=1 Tax=Arthrobacter sp. MYb227 TaxID=1848601 RepID=UPI000CFCF6FF|nr:hypothetical protein [Arthrobacter sp. MYb227]PQZ86439.1 hypothetical protein CQ018_18960 [Arthrobacter sp. MYb227]